MAKKLTGWKTRGMNRDLSVSAFNPEFAFENRNLRLSTNESNTLMSWVNEKGTQLMGIHYSAYRSNNQLQTQSSIYGLVIGTAVLNHHLVVFTTDNITPIFVAQNRQSREYKDCIYVFEMSGNSGLKGKLLFSGNLGFDAEHPLETLVSYETESVQKVYWTDSKNQPRVINIAAPESAVMKWGDTSFDFVRTLQLNETVTVKKILGASGMFPAGVLQYAFTYYDKHGQESSIFYTTPLLYTSYEDRGANPEDRVDNAFQITVNRVDRNFDYLRIYSIMRTSKNGTPICRRVQDISIADLNVDQNGISNATCLDTGTNGDTIDSMELMYKGGEDIVCQTLEQKDNTLFLGNLEIKRNPLNSISISNPKIDFGTRSIHPSKAPAGSYKYWNQLTAYDENNNSVPCNGFKCGDTYRLGIQFQYKTGKWSEPVYLKDLTMSMRASIDADNKVVSLPTFTWTMPAALKNTLREEGYLKARPLCVFPEATDRNIVCQGVANPTMYTQAQRNSSTTNNNNYTGELQAQSSWFFRPYKRNSSSGAEYGGAIINGNGTVSPDSRGEIPYANRDVKGNNPFNPTKLRSVEIQGDFDSSNRFKIDTACFTLHSPDIEFDDQLLLMDFGAIKFKQVGHVLFKNTLSDIDIQTETPAISEAGNGFVHRAFDAAGACGIIAGLFYDDFIVEDIKKNEATGEENTFQALDTERSSIKWMVYPWNKSGSLNNDINRPTDKGTQTAKLKKKIISNLRIADTAYTNEKLPTTPSVSPKIFSDDQNTILKVGDYIYRGNIDTLLIPDHSDGQYFVDSNTLTLSTTTGSWATNWAHRIINSTYTPGKNEGQTTPFNATQFWWKTFSVENTVQDSTHCGLWVFKDNEGWCWVQNSDATNLYIGNQYVGLVLQKGNVRMKYKSTPHMVLRYPGDDNIDWNGESGTFDYFSLPVIEITQEPKNQFGGNSDDAKQANVWIPCGEPVRLDSDNPIVWKYGDTYFQRWDCLKTYAFTFEDENQVVEIGSFMLETHTNIDGRYDRNRGQSSNLYMSPRNFNLLNPVYSQIDNFFTYRIMDKGFYENNTFPNQLTWTLTKQAGADVDTWTTLTMANTLDMDGDKGKVTKLIRLNDSLLSFQDTGISQIMYNENVQVASTQGVPIEIANSGKVQGKRYLSNTVGCSNKWSMVSTPMGIYFMDSHEKSIYVFNGQLNNLSTSLGFNSWVKQNIQGPTSVWNPKNFGSFVGYYDRRNQDVLYINHNEALAYSEKLNAFTSFYDYGRTPYLCFLRDTGIWLRHNNHVTTAWVHQGGEYCKFFDENKSYGTILIGNPEPQLDKTFTNLEFRACVDGEGKYNEGRYEPFLPFDTLETWNEYQKGIAYLSDKQGQGRYQHHLRDNTASLNRKFRIWRCDIPRDNAGGEDVFDFTFDSTFHYSRSAHPTDRMRNPWLYLKLRKAPAKEEESLPRAEIHDLVMTYYD